MTPINHQPILREMALLDSVAASLYCNAMDDRIRNHQYVKSWETPEAREAFADEAEKLANLCYQAAMAWGVVRAKVYSTTVDTEKPDG